MTVPPASGREPILERRAAVPLAGGDAELAWREAGAGRPLVLVHGNFASSRWWLEQLADPVPGWRHVAPDLPNFGASAPLAGDIAVAAYARALLAFLDALGLERPVLVGHSLGGAVVQEAVALEPGRAAGLMLVDAAPPEGLPRPDAIERLRSLRGQRERMRAALEPMAPSRRPGWFGDLVDDALRMAEPAFGGNALALDHDDRTPRLAAFRGPVLVLRGALDPLIDEAAARRTAAAFPDAVPPARLVLWDDVGHSPQLEAPERFRALLSEFLGEVP